MSGRDPRRDPRAGDVVRKGLADRRVESVDGLSVYYTATYGLRGSDGVVYSAETDNWRRWAAGAEVLRTGEGVQGG